MNYILLWWNSETFVFEELYYVDKQAFHYRVFNLSCGRVVYRVEKSKVLMEDTWEKDLDLRLSKRTHKPYSNAVWFKNVGIGWIRFSNKIQKGKTCYSEEQVISMLEFLIDNILVSFGGSLFQQIVGIPMGTNCTPLLADLLWLKALWIVSFKRVFNLSCGRVVYRVEKSKVLMEDTWEKDLDLRLSSKESEDLPYLYWIPKLHKTPYKERYIAGSSTCSTKDSVCSKRGTTEILWNCLHA
jgi:hypothetical protein